MKIAKSIPKNDVLVNANVIKIHTNYKTKTGADEKLKLNARNAPHGNEDDLKTLLSKEYAMCSLIGLKTVRFIASYFGWLIY